MSKKILIVSYFCKNHVGYTVFLYRINLMRELGSIVVVSNNIEARDKLKLKDEEFICYESKRESTKELFIYLFKCWLLYIKMRPSFVFLMQSRLALFSCIFRNKKKFILFWDIHPTQLFGIHSKKHNKAIRYFVDIINGCLREGCYAGAKLSSTVMPVSEILEKDLIEKKVDPNKIKLIYLGVDDMFIPPFENKPVDHNSPLKLLYAGSLTEERGRDIMLFGLAKALSKGADADLMIIGCDPKIRQEVETIAIRLGIMDHITILGIIEGDCIPKYMHSSDIGLNLWENNPYFCKNPPTKLFEYLVSGLPVVVNNIETHNSHVINGVTGYIIPYSEEGFANIIGYISKNKNLIPFMSQNARAQSDKYRWIHQKDKMKEALTKYVQ